MKRFLFIIITLLIFNQVIAEKQDNFRGRLFYAKELLRNSQLITAYPYYMELYEEDPDNANVNYSLGVCYTLEHVVSRKSIFHLEKAIKDIALDYEVNPTRENQSPVYAYYYLIMAYVQNGQCEKANETLKIFKQIYGKEDLFTMDAEWLVQNCNTKHKLIKEQDFPIDPAYLAAKGITPPKTEKPTVTTSKEVVPTNTDRPEKPNTFKNVYKTKVTTTIYDSKEDANIFNNRLQDSLKEVAIIEDKADVPILPTTDEVITKPVEYTSKIPLYGVQIGAFTTLIPTRTFDNLKNVEAYMDFDGIIRYVIGGFNSKTYAERLLKIIKEKGYSNAFIVDINKKSRYGNEVISMNGISIRKYAWDGKEDLNLEYRVQVGAFRDLTNAKIELVYLELENMKEINLGNITLLTVGAFKTYEETQGYLHQVKEAGIKDAFIVVFNSAGVRVPLDK